MEGDAVWKLLLRSDDELSDTIEKDVAALNRLTASATAASAAVKAMPTRRPGVVARSGGGAGAGGGGGGGGGTTSFTPIDPMEAARIGALYRLRSMQGEAPGAARGPLNRVLNKLFPGGGLGNAIGDSMGGGIGATVGTGVLFAAAQGVRMLVEEARALDATAKQTSATIQNLTKWSDSAVTTLARLGDTVETLVKLAKSYGADNLAKQVGRGQAAVGLLAQPFVDNPLTRAILDTVGGKGTGEAAVNLIDRWNAQALGTINGDDLGTQAAGQAAQRLEKAKERRKAAAAAAAGSTLGDVPLFAPSVDELTRVGLFRGGSPQFSETNNILREHTMKLEAIARRLAEVPEGIASNL